MFFFSPFVLNMAAAAGAGGITVFATDYDQTSNAKINDVTVDLSALSVAENDIVLCWCTYADFGIDGGPATSTSSTGWSSTAQIVGNDTYDTRSALYYKTMGATPDTSFVLNKNASLSGNGGSSVSTVVVRGATSVDQLITASGINTDRPNPPSITPAAADNMLVFFGAAFHQGDDIAYTSSDQSNFTYNNSLATYDHVSTIGYELSVDTSAVDKAQLGGGQNNANHSWTALSVELS